jgi:hypothetical protein
MGEPKVRRPHAGSRPDRPRGGTRAGRGFERISDALALLPNAVLIDALLLMLTEPFRVRLDRPAASAPTIPAVTSVVTMAIDWRTDQSNS